MIPKCGVFFQVGCLNESDFLLSLLIYIPFSLYFIESGLTDPFLIEEA